MWKEKNCQEFASAVSDIIVDPMVQAMRHVRHHADDISCLDHSVYVAYVSFIICRKLGLNANSAARAGMLHDLYLCRWERTKVNRLKRLTLHPHIALSNATSRFELSKLEKDIIVKHMWPVTLFHLPLYRESFVVNVVDTMCAIAEFAGIYRLIKAKQNLGGLVKIKGTVTN